MTKRSSTFIAATIVLALVALLLYSLDRTSWLLAQYEVDTPGTLAEWLGLSPLALGVAAALVIEVGAVALVAGDVLALERSAIKRYATAGLAVVLSVQALANLLAGFLRGFASVERTLRASGASVDVAWWVAGLAWVLSSAAVPALIFILSKLAAHVVRLALSAPHIALSTTTAERSDDAQERSGRAETTETPDSATAQDGAPVSAANNHALFPVSAHRSTAQPIASAPLRSLTADTVIALDRYPCPHCGRALASGRAVGAAKTNGYCQFCKAERKAI